MDWIMTAKKSTKNKLPADYACSDLLNVWRDSYREIFGNEYSSAHYRGYELHKLKELLDEHGVYEILLAMKSALQDGCDLVYYFYSNIERYLPHSYYSKYYYLIGKYGTCDLRTDMFNLSVLEKKWSPNANTIRSMGEIIDRFDIFLQAKNLV